MSIIVSCTSRQLSSIVRDYLVVQGFEARVVPQAELIATGAALFERAPAAVLVDLPAAGAGLDFHRKLRHMAIRDGIPVIIVQHPAAPMIRGMRFYTAASDVLQMPAQLKLLPVRLRSLVANRKDRDYRQSAASGMTANDM